MSEILDLPYYEKDILVMIEVAEAKANT